MLNSQRAHRWPLINNRLPWLYGAIEPDGYEYACLPAWYVSIIIIIIVVIVVSTDPLGRGSECGFKRHDATQSGMIIVARMLF